MKTITFSLVALIFVVCSNLNPKKTMSSTSPKISIHSFTVQDINGQTYDFAALKGKKILVGAIDVSTKKIETPEQVANILRRACKYVEPKNILGCTNCGLVTFPQEIANANMNALALGAKILNKELGLN